MSAALAAPARILVVDDEPDCTLELVEHLEMNGHPCTGVTDPREALRVFAADGSIGLVVSDVKMPGMDGIALTRAISEAAGEERPVAFVLVTGHAGLTEARQALHLGAVDFILKPIDLDDLDGAIDRAMLRVRGGVVETAMIPGLRAAMREAPDGEPLETSLARLAALPGMSFAPVDDGEAAASGQVGLGQLAADILERNGPAVTARSLRTMVRGEATAEGRTAAIEATFARLVGASVGASAVAGNLEIAVENAAGRARVAVSLGVDAGERRALAVGLALAAAWARVAEGSLAVAESGGTVVLSLDLPGAR